MNTSKLITARDIVLTLHDSIFCRKNPLQQWSQIRFIKQSMQSATDGKQHLIMQPLPTNDKTGGKGRDLPTAAADTAAAEAQRCCWTPLHAEPAAAEGLNRPLLAAHSRPSGTAAGGWAQDC